MIIVLYTFLEQLWTEESRDKWCPNSEVSQGVTTQEGCQKKCKAESACVGISYSHKDEVNRRYCYMCWDDVLKSSFNDFGFYRRPGKKKLSVNSRVEAFSHFT